MHEEQNPNPSIRPEQDSPLHSRALFAIARWSERKPVGSAITLFALTMFFLIVLALYLSSSNYRVINVQLSGPGVWGGLFPERDSGDSGKKWDDLNKQVAALTTRVDRLEQAGHHPALDIHMDRGATMAFTVDPAKQAAHPDGAH